jgi:hypothetical protein
MCDRVVDTTRIDGFVAMATASCYFLMLESIA